MEYRTPVIPSGIDLGSDATVVQKSPPLQRVENMFIIVCWPLGVPQNPLGVYYF